MASIRLSICSAFFIFRRLREQVLVKLTINWPALMQDLTETIVAVDVTVNSAVDVTVKREFTLRLSKLERR